MTSDFMQQVQEDIEEGVYRGVSRTITKNVRDAIITMFKDKGADEQKISVIREIMETEIGVAVISALLGYTIPQLPMIGEDERALRLADNFRIEGYAGLAGMASEAALKYIFPAINTAMAALPAIPGAEAAKEAVQQLRAPAEVVPVFEDDHEDTVALMAERDALKKEIQALKANKI